MSTATTTLGQQYYEEVEALKAEGLSQSDAIRKVAEQHDKRAGAVRGSIYGYRTRHLGESSNGGGSRRRTRYSVDDHLGRARQSLVQARDLIEQEVLEARAALDAATEHYEQVSTAATERTADIEAKLAALA